MSCARCGHEHVESIKGWATATLAFEECLANLRADFKTERMKRQGTEMLVQRMVEDHEDVKQRLAESRQKELDAETRACAAEERAHRLETAPPEDGTAERLIWTPTSFDVPLHLDLSVSIPCPCGETHEPSFAGWDGKPQRYLAACGRLLEFSAGLTVHGRIVRTVS